MPKIETERPLIDLSTVLGGSTISLPVTDPFSVYGITGGGVVTGNIVVQSSGTPLKGHLYKILYNGTVTYGGGKVTIFGTDLSEAQAGNRSVIYVYYNTVLGGPTGFFVSVLPDIVDSALVETTDIVNDAVTVAKIAQGTAGQLLMSSAVPDTAWTTLSGDATLAGTGAMTIANDAVTAAKIAQGTSGQILMSSAVPDTTWTTMTGDATISGAGAITIANNAVTTAKVNASAITADKLSNDAAYGTISIPVSFETGEQCENIVYTKFKCQIEELRFAVTKAIGAVDNGTITGSIDGVGITSGVITVTAAAALNTVFTATPTANNVTLTGAFSTLRFTTAKVTVGGKGLLTVIYKKII